MFATRSLGLYSTRFLKSNVSKSFRCIQPASSLLAFRFASTNFNDVDAHKPTLDIDPFAKAARLKRPTSPHLFIYQPQLTWVMSGAFRVVSVGLGGLLYLTAMGYAIAPLESAALAAYVHSFPSLLLFLGKLTIGTPFFFHCYNGMRHLIWDTASQLKVKDVYKTGHIVLGLTAITSVLFALFY